jgi:glyceraldehyde 3-phosphate dehydrogenase
MVRLAINGYGRIGRMAHRVILEKYKTKIDVVAINAGLSTDLAGWMYLLKYDTVYGPLKDDLAIQSSKESKKDYLGKIVVNKRRKTHVFSQKDPSLLPWEDLKIDVVIESTGHFTSLDKLNLHLKAGAKNVVLSAPAKGGNVETYVLSVNDSDYSGTNVISNASCTTNCIAPVAKVISDNFGIEKAMMTTIHGYTQDQRLQDGGHEDYRRGRAAGENIVPTSTGATIAAAKALPELEGIFSGLAIRVPIPVGSLADFTFLLKKEASVDEVNSAFKKAAGSSIFKGILQATQDPIVSSDIVGNSHSAIVDLSLTQVVGGDMVKVIAWYDNEYAYANRLVEEVLMVGKATQDS